MLMQGRQGMVFVMQRLVKMTPFLFGIGFIAPLLIQIMALGGFAGPWGLSRAAFGLAFGAGWGLLAVWRGRWL